MARILFYEPSFRAVEARLPKSGVEAVLMAPDASLSLNGKPISLADARIEVGWTNVELLGGPWGEYMRALKQSPGLKWMHSAGAGFEAPIFAELVRRGVRLTNSHSQAIGISDLVLWGVLDHYQGGPERRAAERDHRWRQAPFREIMGTTWLVIGFGAIGQETARRARAFGARIIGARRSAGAHELADEMITADEILGRLPEADVVVLSLPLSRHTAGIAGKTFFAAMKLRSVLVNVGRGGLVDEAALLAALKRGAPEHAALDVFQKEPQPADGPFWDHPQVALTGHTAGLGSGLPVRNHALFIDNLERYLSGRPLLNEVSPSDVLEA